MEDMVCLSCNATGERVCLAAEGFGNRTCFLENITDKNSPPDLSQCVFVIEQALSVRALQELVTAAANESVGDERGGRGTIGCFGSCARFLLGGEHGRLKYPPPEAHSPVNECLLPYQASAPSTSRRVPPPLPGECLLH
ncbi:hypothetical protein HAZT_HAZT004820 [Hyalella azteca]|uniref:Inositol 1,4,5-trisphosphate/ryanodine receptor domain-containing protein n=1 Tax=Hyalella azteca TaxID=294128 RepID=A0A6A0HCS9_HYAAZ|nr:hypothetical protein HAZT_HAZT004820 [Hyalella azteca]